MSTPFMGRAAGQEEIIVAGNGSLAGLSRNWFGGEVISAKPRQVLTGGQVHTPVRLAVEQSPFRRMSRQVVRHDVFSAKQVDGCGGQRDGHHRLRLIVDKDVLTATSKHEE